jgi:hypothetical protein
MSQLTNVNTKLNSLETSLLAANATIAALEKSHETDVQERVAAARKELKAELTKASRDGDHEAIVDLTEKLVELNTVEKKEEKKEKKEERKEERPAVDPVFTNWCQLHPEFVKNPRKVALANAVSDELRQKGDLSTGMEFLDKVAEEVEKVLGGNSHSRVSGGDGGSGRGSSGTEPSKTYADLPKEAKDACESMASRLVGAKRAHKDINSWRESYARQFWEQEAKLT